MERHASAVFAAIACVLVWGISSWGEEQRTVRIEFKAADGKRTQLPDRSSRQWEHVEWALPNVSYEGNPFDLVAEVTFEHESGKETRATEMFYAGDGRHWKFRFTTGRTGKWTFRTRSDDPDLDGRRGTVAISPNPDAYGFVTHKGNKWARPLAPDNRLEAFVPQFVMYATPEAYHGKPDKVDADIKTFMAGHGFNGFHTYVCCRWFDIGEMRSDRIKSKDPNPDPRTFEALELLITKVHAAGGVTHVWAWGDEARRWTPARWGKNGTADRRLQRYIAARLGPLPGWTMGYGFDNFEWVNEEDLRKWHTHMHDHLGWFHFLGARAHKNKLTQIYDGLDYASYEQHRPDYEKYVEAIEKQPAKPAFSEDRFRILQDGGHAYKDYTDEMTRRGLWHSTMAGGVANIWGCLDRQSSALGSKPYAHPEWILCYAKFFRGRFLIDMARDNTLTDGVCLRTPDGSRLVFYKEDATGIRLELPRISGPQAAVAVDAKKAYKEIDLGRLDAKSHKIKLPYSSDWAIAVGRFPGIVKGLK